MKDFKTNRLGGQWETGRQAQAAARSNCATATRLAAYFRPLSSHILQLSVISQSQFCPKVRGTAFCVPSACWSCCCWLRLRELPNVHILQPQLLGYRTQRYLFDPLEPLLGFLYQACPHLHARQQRVSSWRAGKIAARSHLTTAAQAPRQQHTCASQNLSVASSSNACRLASGARRSNDTKQRVEGPHRPAHVSTKAGVEGLLPSWSI